MLGTVSYNKLKNVCLVVHNLVPDVHGSYNSSPLLPRVLPGGQTSLLGTPEDLLIGPCPLPLPSDIGTSFLCFYLQTGTVETERCGTLEHSDGRRRRLYCGWGRRGRATSKEKSRRVLTKDRRKLVVVMAVRIGGHGLHRRVRPRRLFRRRPVQAKTRGVPSILAWSPDRTRVNTGFDLYEPCIVLDKVMYHRATFCKKLYKTAPNVQVCVPMVQLPQFNNTSTYFDLN
jgi:hypothetical protein